MVIIQINIQGAKAKLHSLNKKSRSALYIPRKKFVGEASYRFLHARTPSLNNNNTTGYCNILINFLDINNLF